MFSGIVELTGFVKLNTPCGQGNQLLIQSDLKDLQLGESIAVNGVCLTLSEQNNNVLTFDVSPETLALTTLRSLNAGNEVNLERALAVSARMGGHYVSGHVDKTARVAALDYQGDYTLMKLEGFSKEDWNYLLPKGSVTVEGVSLTINRTDKQGIELMLIPHTVNHTHFKTLNTGQDVNIEFDYIARIVAHQVRLATRALEV